MSEVLTLDEIKRRYISEWIIVADPVTDEAMNVLAGRVIIHGMDRDEVDRQLLAYHPRPRSYASIFNGCFPEDMAIVL